MYPASTILNIFGISYPQSYTIVYTQTHSTIALKLTLFLT